MNPLYSTKKQTTLVFLVALGLACFGLSPSMQGVVPAPDGGYPGGNTAEGQSALLSLTSGGYNTAVGFLSLRSDTTSSFNTAVGAGALFANTGAENTATGAGALLSNTTGIANTANGAFALFSNTTATANTAVGHSALISNTTGGGNTALGESALFSNTTATDNTATGAAALVFNTTGFQNTANGRFALFNNTTGDSNTATGHDALLSSTTGNENTALGAFALEGNTTGGINTAIGTSSLDGNTTGFENTALGGAAGFNVITANNVICIGSGVGGADVSDTCFIGNIRGMTTINNNAIPVLIDSAGQLGTASSSQRYKTDIKRIDKTSESILALKPVSFRYKVHKDATPQFGLIAEDVAKVNPDLVIYDADRKPYTVRYDAVNAMLLNEFLKEHRKVQEQGVTITDLKSNAVKQEATIAHLQKRIEALAAGLQKVSAQLEVTKSAPQMVRNDQ